MCTELSLTLDVLCQFNIKKGVADAPDILKEMMKNDRPEQENETEAEKEE